LPEADAPFSHPATPPFKIGTAMEWDAPCPRGCTCGQNYPDTKVSFCTPAGTNVAIES